MRFLKALLLLGLVLSVLGSTFPADAQTGLVSGVGEQESTQKSSGQNVTKEDLSGLVKTLENPEERKEFIDNLNALIQSDENISASSATEEEGIPAPRLSEVLGLEGQTKELANDLEAFLDEHNLNSSYIGKALSTLGTFFIFLILCYITLRLSRALRDYILPVAERYYIDAGRIRLYNRFIRYFVYFLLVLVLIYFNGIIWGLSEFGFLKNTYLVGMIGDIFSILLITIVATTAWEVISGFIEFAMQRVTGKYSKRLHTLLPIVRNVLFFVFAVMFTLVLLSELGVDIMPLLAGAGVVGIAVGFGAQTMVKDFLTGFVIIMEDLVQVGDVVTVGGKTGIIEKITIRKIQLRDLDGTVYTVPFSEISVVSNLTKDYSYYLMDVGIAYREDPDEVIQYLREIDEEMREDDDFGPLILDPIHILGVDQFGDSAIVIKARIKTQPIKQWDVGREFNRRMKYKFDKHNIEIPFPHQTLYFGEDKDGSAPPAYVQVQDKSGSREKTTPSKSKTASSKKKGDSPKKKKPGKTGIESTEDAED